MKFFLSFDKPFRYFPYFLLFVAAILFLLRFDLTIAYPILFGVWVGTGAGLAVASSNFKSSIKLLSSFDDIKTVALLCRLLALKTDATIQPAKEALTRLLPQLSRIDMDLLSFRERKQIYAFLNIRESEMNIAFVLAILHMVQTLHDTEALRHVRALAQSKPDTINQYRVFEAAQECLSFLDSVANNHSQKITLVRAVNNDLSPDFLLHPINALIDRTQQDSKVTATKTVQHDEILDNRRI